MNQIVGFSPPLKISARGPLRVQKMLFIIILSATFSRIVMLKKGYPEITIFVSFLRINTFPRSLYVNIGCGNGISGRLWLLLCRFFLFFAGRKCSRHQQQRQKENSRVPPARSDKVEQSLHPTLRSTPFHLCGVIEM